jgi:hypothetical protein
VKISPLSSSTRSAKRGRGRQAPARAPSSTTVPRSPMIHGSPKRPKTHADQRSLGCSREAAQRRFLECLPASVGPHAGNSTQVCTPTVPGIGGRNPACVGGRGILGQVALSAWVGRFSTGQTPRADGSQISLWIWRFRRMGRPSRRIHSARSAGLSSLTTGEKRIGSPVGSRDTASWTHARAHS